MQPNLFTNSRSNVYYCWYYDPNDGKRKQFSCRTANRRDATKHAQQELTRILTGAKQKHLPQTLTAFRDEYLRAGIIGHKGKGATAKTLQTVKDSFNQLEKRIGDKVLHKINVRDCQTFIMTGQPSVHSARKHYAQLRSAFDTAVSWGIMLENPFAKFKRLTSPEGETDFFTDREFELFHVTLPTASYAERRLSNLVVLAYETGLRLGEVRFLERRAIDLAGQKIIVRNTNSHTTKSGKVRHVPLSNRAIEAIQQQTIDNFSNLLERVRESLYLFPNEIGAALSESTIEGKFSTYRKKLWPNRKLSFHSLRHSFGTRLALAGVPLQHIQKIMGHSTVTTTERYLHLANIDFSPALDVLNRCGKSTVTVAENEQLAY